MGIKNLAILGIILVFVILLVLLTGKESVKTQETQKPRTLTPKDKSQDSQDYGFSQISLEIDNPKNGSTVSSNTITVRGKTSAHAEVFVNEAETKADANGHFEVSLTLEEGENEIIIVANDAYGAASEKIVSVNYEPG